MPSVWEYVVYTTKSGLVIFLMLMGLRTYYIKNKRITAIMWILVYYIVILLAMLLYQFFFPLIIVDYYIILGAQSGQLI